MYLVVTLPYSQLRELTHDFSKAHACFLVKNLCPKNILQDILLY